MQVLEADSISSGSVRVSNGKITLTAETHLPNGGEVLPVSSPLPLVPPSIAPGLALQLQQPAFEVSLLCGGLMSAPPSRPSNDEGWLNAPLRQSDRDAPDFLHRPGNRQAWR